MPATQKQLQYTRFNDFRPGIVSRSGHALGGVGLPAPLGSAQETNTYRCFALPTGGLAPLPRLIDSFSPGPPEASAPTNGYWIVGFLAVGPQASGTFSSYRYDDQIFIAVAYKFGGVQRYRLLRARTFVSPGTTVDVIRSINSTYAGANFYETAWLFETRVAHPVDPVTAPGTPVVASAWATPGGSAEMTIDLFPDPNASGITAGINLFLNRWGQLYGHQGRIVLNEMNPYFIGGVGLSTVEEQISFTDPPNSYNGTFGTQNEVFSQESPTGYGAFGSVSAGELFLVKRQGGGIIVSGDIAFPTITRLPGVVGTGSCTNNRAASTSIGLVYAVKSGGVYVWRGSDTSEKLSRSLEDTAFEHPNAPPRVDSSGYGNKPVVSIESWGNWILASNNWIYDTDTNGWFKMDDPSLVNCMYWSKSWSGQFMFGALPQYTQTSPTGFYSWDRNLGALSYSWQSQPLYLTKERVLLVREVVVLAEGAGTVNITLTKLDGTTQTESFTFTATTFPQLLRKRTAAKGYTAIMRIETNGGSNPAPIVHSVDLGWEESTEASAAA